MRCTVGICHVGLQLIYSIYQAIHVHLKYDFQIASIVGLNLDNFDLKSSQPISTIPLDIIIILMIN